MTKDLKDKTLAELEEIVISFGGQKYLAKYIFRFIHLLVISDINQITPLSKTFRNKLITNDYFISQLKIIDKFVASDGATKYLFELCDGNRIETVFLPSRTRHTVCVSTQVGCLMNCLFCATAGIKFKRNLTAAEIVDQLNTVAKDIGKKVTNIVYMGMGEPLSNYEAVLKAVRILNHPDGKNIGIRRQTISTCGNADGIRRLANDSVYPRLAISLNASSDSTRAKLMPINTKYSIPKLLQAVKFYQVKTRMRVTFEYVLIKGLNDGTSDAYALTKLLKGLMCNVNLIEYNPHPGCKLTASSPATVKRFAGILEEAGLETSIRFKMGRKIKAACGQLGAGLK
jgi:23S rRNA (adenine2503-C2)-methyltransferase